MKKYIILLFLFVSLGIVYRWKVAKTTNSGGQTEIVFEHEARGEIITMDPARCIAMDTASAIGKVYEGLLEYHYLKRPLELVPNLVEEMPKISEDGCVYTFTIKPNIFFHDNICFPDGKGRELVAEDFVFSIKRIADSKIQSEYYECIRDKIKGLNEWRQKYQDVSQTNYDEEIEGVKSLNKYTLQFTLNEPSSVFLDILAMPVFYVVAQEAVKHYGLSFGNHPVGTGPFIVKEFSDIHKKVMFYKNPTFREKLFPKEAALEYQHTLAYAGQRLPLVDKIITHVMKEESPRWLQFKSGKLDSLCIHNTSIALEVIQEGKLISGLQDKGVQLFSSPGSNVHFFGFNFNNKLFGKNEALRQAISMAFDSQKYNQIFFRGMATVAHGIIPPDLVGYEKDYINPYSYDLQKAKECLVKAGYPNGNGLPEIILDTRADTVGKQRVEFFAKCMKEIGIQVKVSTNLWSELLAKVNKGSTMMHMLQWAADYPDAHNFFSILYNGSILAGIRFSDPEFNKIYEQVSCMQNSAEKIMLYQQLNHIVGKRVPMVCTVHTPNQALYHKWVKNFVYNIYNFGMEQYIAIDVRAKNAFKGD